MVSDQECVDALNVIDRYQKLLKHNIEIICIDCKQGQHNIIEAQLFSLLFQNQTELLQSLDNIREQYENAIAQVLGLDKVIEGDD
jgi:glycine cleavage system regulatory protein